MAKKLSIFFVVWSGKPDGESYDREVILVAGVRTLEAAVRNAAIQLPEDREDWHWGPDGKSFDNLSEACEYAIYRISDNGSIYSDFRVIGFSKEKNDRMLDFVTQNAADRPRKLPTLPK